MEDVGGKEDTELGREDLALIWRELPVESLDTVSLLAMDVFREGSREAAEPSLFPSLEEQPVSALVGRLVVRREVLGDE